MKVIYERAVETAAECKQPYGNANTGTRKIRDEFGNACGEFCVSPKTCCEGSVDVLGKHVVDLYESRDLDREINEGRGVNDGGGG